MKFLENGSIKTQFELDGHQYKLVNQNRWIVVYASETRRKVIVSKIFLGIFDLQLLETFFPEDLAGNERANAALAIKTAGAKIAIPQVWKEFANEFSFSKGE